LPAARQEQAVRHPAARLWPALRRQANAGAAPCKLHDARGPFVQLARLLASSMRCVEGASWHRPCTAVSGHIVEVVMDAVFLLVTVGFFALAIAYARACDHL
jgi:hypothetical protein